MLANSSIKLRLEMWIGGVKYDFSDRLYSISDITKKIEERGGSFTCGDINFELSNEDGLFLEDGPLFSLNTWVNRPVIVTAITEDQSEVKLFGGYLQFKTETDNGSIVEFKARELTRLWMDRSFVFDTGVNSIIYKNDVTAHFDFVPIIPDEGQDFTRVKLARTTEEIPSDSLVEIINNDGVVCIKTIFASENNDDTINAKIKYENSTLKFSSNGINFGIPVSIAINLNYQIYDGVAGKTSNYVLVRVIKIPSSVVTWDIQIYSSTLPKLEYRNIKNPADVFWDLVVNHSGFQASDDIWQFIEESVWLISYKKLDDRVIERTLIATESYKILNLIEELTTSFAIFLYVLEDGHVIFDAIEPEIAEPTFYVPNEWIIESNVEYDVNDMYNHVLWTYGSQDNEKVYSSFVYGKSYQEYRVLRTLEIKSYWLPSHISTDILNSMAEKIYYKYGRPLPRRRIELGVGGFQTLINDILLINNRLWKVFEYRKRPIPFRTSFDLLPADEYGEKWAFVAADDTPINLGDPFAEACYEKGEIPYETRVKYPELSIGGFSDGQSMWEKCPYLIS